MQCPLTGYKTNCTDNCRDCARDLAKEVEQGKIPDSLEIELLQNYT